MTLGIVKFSIFLNVFETLASLENYPPKSEVLFSMNTTKSSPEEAVAPKFFLLKN